MYHVSPLFYTFAIDIWAWYNQLANCKAFKRMDKDGSGSVNKEEMYSGLLLLQLNLAKYAGPSACKVSVKKEGYFCSLSRWSTQIKIEVYRTCLFKISSFANYSM